MRIERENGEAVGSVWAVFTVAEARALFDSLGAFFEELEEGPRDLGWHQHVGEQPNELTIAVEEPDDPPPPKSN